MTEQITRGEGTRPRSTKAALGAQRQRSSWVRVGARGAGWSRHRHGQPRAGPPAAGSRSSQGTFRWEALGDFGRPLILCSPPAPGPSSFLSRRFRALRRSHAPSDPRPGQEAPQRKFVTRFPVGPRAAVLLPRSLGSALVRATCRFVPRGRSWLRFVLPGCLLLVLER